MGRRVKGAVVAAACATLLGTFLGVANVVASPDTWPSDFSDQAIILSCPGGELALLAPHGRGPLVPAQVAEDTGVVFPPPARLGHQVFIPYRVYFEQKNYSRGTLVGTTVLADDSKGSPVPSDAITCVTSYGFPDGDGNVRSYYYSVTGVMRGEPAP